MKTYLKNFLFDIFFPKKCASCGKIDTYLCDSCLKKIPFIKSPLCSGCGKLSQKGKYCRTCRPKNSLTGIMIAAHFEEGPLKELIHFFKYDGLTDLKYLLATFLEDTLKQNGFYKNYLVTYVPLHKSRLNWRGYNQSELLAEELSKNLGLKLIKNAIIKTQKTKSQIGLKRKERLNNPEGAFQVNPKLKNQISGKKIIIIDDIITTGATLNACAKELRKLRAREVWGLAVGKH